MRIKIVGLAFAIALLSVMSVIGFAPFGPSDTAEAGIHPIVQSDCASSRTGDTPADTENPPGQSDNPSTGDGMPHDGNGGTSHDSGRGADHPWRNSNENASSGEGKANCANPENEKR